MALPFWNRSFRIAFKGNKMPIKFKTKAFEEAVAALQAEASAEVASELADIFEIVGQVHTRLGKIINRPTQAADKPQRKKRGLLRPLRPGTDQVRVLEAVKKWPGNKGFQLATLLAGAGTVVQERTLRTSLRRLAGKRGLIEQRDDGGWYPKEGAK